MFQEKCTLNWTDFDASTSKTFKDLLTDQDFTDVTLSCDDEKQIKAHKVILSASSPVMKRILKYNHHQNPLIYLKGVKFEDLQNMVQFIYMGEAEVKQIHLERFMSLTQEFEVNGLYVKQVAHIPTTISLPDQQLNELDETMITGEIKQEEDMKKVKKAKKLKKSRKSSHVENEVVDASSLLALNPDDAEFSLDEILIKQEGKFKCESCDIVCQNNQNLNRHVRAKHEGIRHYCDQCSYAATQVSSLKRHKITQHFQIMDESL